MQWQKKELSDKHYPNQFYYTCGTGSTKLLLIHGYAETAEIFEHILPLLTDAFTIVLPNLPGSNHTQCLAECSIEALAEFCYCVAKQERFTDFLLMGHSLGGYIALNYAKKFPDGIVAMGLLNSHCFADNDEKKTKRQQAIAIANNGGSAAALRSLVYSIYSAQFLQDQGQEVENHYKYALTQNDTAVAYYNQAMMNRPDTSDTLQNVAMPVLFVIGKQDNTCPMQQLLAQCSYPAVSKVTIFENCGHQSMREKPRELAASILTFQQLITNL
jgi:pimeloyl-ACP methyl ester carboxylesterase